MTLIQHVIEALTNAKANGEDFIGWDFMDIAQDMWEKDYDLGLYPVLDIYEAITDVHFNGDWP